MSLRIDTVPTPGRSPRREQRATRPLGDEILADRTEPVRAVDVALSARLVDVKGAARYLGGLSVPTLRTLIADGVIPTVRLPSLRHRDETMRRILIDLRDLDRLIESWRERNS